MKSYLYIMNLPIYYFGIFIIIALAIHFSIKVSISPSFHVPTQYITYPSHLRRKCTCCGTRVEFLYPSAGHQYTDFHGVFNEIRKFYQCPNPACDLYGIPFNPAPPNVLPFKRFSLGIWKYIAEEAKIFNQKPAQICERLQEKFGLKISEGTIRNYINEIDAYLSSQIDKKTEEVLKAQKKIILAMDGQKPDKEGKALWLFVDLISNRVLNVVILESADYKTLHAIVESILGRFQVKLKGLVSDKQGSIVKMRRLYYPNVRHQYCHFHFLQNLWNHVETKDGNLYKKLLKVIHDLYIMSVPKDMKVYFEGLGKRSIREVFHEVERALRVLIKAQSKKFSRLRGIIVYERLDHYVSQMEAALATEDAKRRVVKIMTKTAAQLREALTQFHEQYQVCVELNSLFQALRKALGKEPEPEVAETTSASVLAGEKRAILDAHFASIWEEVKGLGGITKKAQLKSFQAKKDTEAYKIKQEWVRLYKSYRRGLFTYYYFFESAKTNSPMEAKFSQEKSLFFSRVGKQKVGPQVRIRGEYVLKQLYAGKQEVKAIIDAIPNEYDRETIQQELNKLASRTSEETKLWNNRLDTATGIELVLSKGNSSKTKDSKGEDNLVG